MLVDTLLGFTGISLACLITFFFSLRWSEVSKILIAALLIRIFVLLIGHYFITLPDSTADASSILRHARLFAENGFFNLLENYPGPGFTFIRWMIAIPFSLLGPSDLLAKSISLTLGTGSVFLGWKLAYKLWDHKIANKVGWVMAFFPSLILYSVLTMRAVYICFFLLVAIYGVVNWAKTKKFSSICLAIIGFVAATFFHGASIVGAFIFVGILILTTINNLINSLKNYRIKLSNLILFILLTYVFILYFSNEITIPYLRDFQSITDPDVLLRKMKKSVMGEASYPEWTIATSPIEFLYKIPIRAIYFLFAPFPWDIKETKHIIGMFDGILFIYLTILIFINIKVIWRNFALKIILLILASYIIVFAVGVGNFGTGIRHRSKFVFMFVLLAAPFINNFIFSKKIDKPKRILE